jgi:hypothetical protein
MAFYELHSNVCIVSPAFFHHETTMSCLPKESFSGSSFESQSKTEGNIDVNLSGVLENLGMQTLFLWNLKYHYLLFSNTNWFLALHQFVLISRRHISLGVFQQQHVN